MRNSHKAFYIACLAVAGIMSPQNHTVSAQQPNELIKLLAGSQAPRNFKFCDADKSTRQCKGSKGLKAVGLGGAFLPLGLEVTSLRITSRSASKNNVKLVTKFQTEVNGIAPKCKDANGQYESVTKKLKFKGFYCNWLAIGNVIATFDMDIDRVDLAKKNFSGKYTLRLVGTGNMFGKGYFIAKAG